MKPLTVLHVVTSLDPGGMENGVCNIACGLTQRGIATHIACLERSGPFAERLPDRSAVHVLGKTSGFSPRAAFALWRTLRRTRADVLHSHNLGPLIYASLATLGGRLRPIIHGEHALFAQWEREPRRLRQRRRLYRACCAVHSVSDAQVEEIRALGLGHPRLTAIANGVDTLRFSPGDRGTSRAKLGIPSGVQVAGVVGRFGPYKRHDAMIEAFSLLQEKHPALHLVFVGAGGSEETRIRALAAPHPRILLAGFRADPADYYRAFDVLAIPSVNEGMSNAALEAMACGVPVLGNSGCGHEQIICSGHDGVITNLSTPQHIAAALESLLTGPARLVDMGRAARITAEGKFSLSTMLDRYEQLYRAHTRA